MTFRNDKNILVYTIMEERWKFSKLKCFWVNQLEKKVNLILFLQYLKHFRFLFAKMLPSQY